MSISRKNVANNNQFPIHSAHQHLHQMVFKSEQLQIKPDQFLPNPMFNDDNRVEKNVL